jgi:membrane-bound ClpP family serine protease
MNGGNTLNRITRAARRVPVPRRYSAEWWTALSTIAVVCAAATAWSLYLLEVVSEPLWVLVAAVVAAAIGDIAAALGMEAIAPTRIAVGPNERAAYDSEIKETAVVVSGFELSREGKVFARGETWAARVATGQALPLARGARVTIVDRDGLTLLVQPSSS